MLEDQTEYSLPNSSWPSEAVKLYEKLNDKASDDIEWEKIRVNVPTGKIKTFLEAVGNQMFSYCMFVNKTQQKMECVACVGPWCEGPTGVVHSGAISALHDNVMAFLADNTIGRAVTANLNVIFKRHLPLCVPILITSDVDHMDGQKIFLNSKMMSPDGRIVYSEATSLCILFPVPSSHLG